MNALWKSVLKINLSDWNTSPFVDIPLVSFEYLIKVEEESGRKSAKIEIRTSEKDKAAIGVTLTIHNWDNIRDALENSDLKVTSLSRSNGSLVIARAVDDFVHIYTDENGKIFGVSLRQEVIEKLMKHKEALDFVVRLAIDASSEKIQRLTKYVFAYTVHCLLRKELQKSCMACNIEMEGEFDDGSTPHSCINGRTGEEVVASQAFSTAVTLPTLDARFTQLFMALAKHLNISMETAINVKNICIPLFRNSEELKCIIRDVINGRGEYFFVFDWTLQTIKNAAKAVASVPPKKRKYTSPYEI